MSIKKHLTPVILFSLILLISGCSAEKEADSPKFISGTIIVVGNEPFTNLAVQTGPSDVVILDCSKEIKDILLNNQGKPVKIYYEKIDNTKKPTVVYVKRYELNPEENK